MANTKRALLTSALAIVACVAMLIGSTFAWFTDTASTGVNKIQAGNLDVKLEYKNTKGADFKEAKADTPVFKDGALWEPGHVEYVVLKVSNAGNLALKYKLGINIASEKKSTNVYGDTFKLSDYIRFAVLNGDKTEGDINRDALVGEAGEGAALNEGYTADGQLSKKGDANIVTLVVWMPTTVGNEANHKTDVDAPEIDLGITVVATQDTVESDSFGPEYDRDALYPAISQEELDSQLKDAPEGSTIVIPAGASMKLDQNSPIKNGTTLAGGGIGKTTLNAENVSVKKDDVVIKDMTIKGSGSAGTGGTLNINGNNTTIENVDYQGDGNIAITISTGENNAGTVIKNTKITNAFRGLQFWALSGNSVVSNCVLDIAGYTFNIDSAVAGSTLTIKDTTLNGWTSYTSGIELVSFENCKLGLKAYEYLRPYSETKLTNCEFTSVGYQLNAGGSDAYTITLTNCTKNGVAITADNVKAILDMDGWNKNATLIVNGTKVTVD